MKLKTSYHSCILKCVLFFLSFILILSCRKDNIVNSNSGVINAGKITYLALGDSYTIGESVAESERFPVQLMTILKNDQIKIGAPDIVAVTGWTTGDLLNALDTNPPKNNYSFVTLLIGVNNQYQGRSLDEYKTEFSQLLNLAIACAANKKDHVFVLSIPDYSVTPFGNNIDKEKTAQEIDQFNEANHLISQNAGVNYVDITPISREAKNDASLIARDGLHPSSLQYFKWDQLLAPLVFRAITQ